MNKTDSKILFQLAIEKCITPYTSSTIYQILEKFKFSYSTVNYSLKSLIREGFVENGIKDGLKDTYYVTIDGLDKLAELGKMKQKALSFGKGE